MSDAVADAKAELDRAEAAYGAGNWGASRTHYARLLNDPQYAAEALYGLGMIALVQKNSSEAEAHFRQAVARDPYHANSLYQLARLCEVSDPVQARGLYEAALRVNPQHASAQARLRAMNPPEPVGRPAIPVGEPVIPISHRAVAEKGIEYFLERDNSDLSKQTLVFIRRLQVSTRLRVTARLGRILSWAIAAGVIAAAALVGASEADANANYSGPFPVWGAAFAVAGVAAGWWLLYVLYTILWYRTSEVTIANARLYKVVGIVSKHSSVVDIWRISAVTLKRGLVNRMTGDGTLSFRFADAHTKPVSISGLAHGDQLETLYKEIQDLTFLLRANPALKGIIQ